MRFLRVILGAALLYRALCDNLQKFRYENFCQFYFILMVSSSLLNLKKFRYEISRLVGNVPIYLFFPRIWNTEPGLEK